MTLDAKRKMEKAVLKALIVFSLTGFFIICVFPFFWTIMTSIKYTVDAISMPPQWLFTPTLDYYKAIFEESSFLLAFKNTLIVSVVSVVISIVIGAPFGYALSRYSHTSSFVLLVISLIFRALPPMVFIIPYYYIALDWGLYDTKFLLVLVTIAMNEPFTIWMLRSFFITIPKSLDEAAMVDGCNRFQAFFKVIFPIMGTGVATSAIFTLMTAYNEFMLPQALTSSKAVTLPVMISQLTTENIKYWSISAAGSVIIAIPVIVFTLLLQKHLVQGMTSGAVKE